MDTKEVWLNVGADEMDGWPGSRSRQVTVMDRTFHRMRFAYHFPRGRAGAGPLAGGGVWCSWPTYFSSSWRAH